MTAKKYDAFVSYSHADRELAMALQSEMQRYASPWYRARSLRIFRDDTDLTSAGGLGPNIELALSDSGWFILVASPAAAGSQWVQREVAWWLEAKGPTTMLIALADGTIQWAREDFDWARTTALPRLMSRRFPAEPLWTDLRSFRPAPGAASRPRLGDAVAGLAAPVRNTEKSELVGEHIGHRRRTRQLVSATIVVLLLLLGVAVQQGIEAVRQRNDAREQARIATARQLASVAQSLSGSRLDLAQLFAIEAFRADPSPQTLAALTQVSTASPHLVRYLPAGGTVSAIAGAADGSVVVAGTESGRVLRWETSTGTRQEVMRLNGPVSSVATSGDGSIVVAADAERVAVWSGGEAHPVRLPTGHSPLGVAVSPSGRTVAVCSSAPDGTRVLTLSGGAADRSRAASACNRRIAMPTEEEIVSAYGEYWERWSTSDLELINNSRVGLPINNLSDALSGSGAFIGAASSGIIEVWPTQPGNDFFRAPIRALYLPGDRSHPEAFAISDDAKRMAAASSGTIYVVDAKTDPARAPTTVALGGNTGVNDDLLHFYGDSNHLVSASGEALVLWDLTQLGRIARRVPVAVPSGCNACANPWISVAPDGRMLAVVAGDGTTAVVRALDGDSTSQQVFESGGVPFGPPVWADANRLVLPRSTGGDATVVGVERAGSVQWDQPTLHNVTAASLAPDSTVVAVSSKGEVEVRSIATGDVVRSYAGPPELAKSQYERNGFGAISPDGNWVAVLGERLTSTANEGVPPRMLDLRSGQWREIPGGVARDLAYAGNTLLVRRPSGVIELWDAAGTTMWRSIPGSRAFVEGMATNAAGTLIAQQLTDATVTLTDLSSGATLGSFLLPTRGERVGHTGIAFTPDGSALVTVLEGFAIDGEGGEAVVWELTAQALIDRACATVGRDLTAEEWQRYVGGATPSTLICRR
jgi:WD40 repeat protein